MRLFSLATVLALATVAVPDHARPNFSGRWVSGPGDPGVVVEYRESVLSFQYTSEGRNHTFNYGLDGREIRNSIPTSAGVVLSTARAEWIGRRVGITETTEYPDGRSAHSTSFWWLDARGSLVLDVTETFRGQRPTRAVVVRTRVGIAP